MPRADNDPGPGLRERIDALERDRADLEAQVEARRKEQARLAGVLADRRRGIFPPRSKARLLLALTLGGAALVAVTVSRYERADQGHEFQVGVVHDALVPHLLITAAPAEARPLVRVDGALVGPAPRLLPVPPVSRSYEVTLEAPGFAVYRRTLSVTRSGGAHLHAELERAP